nr:PREDICTED: uncharacterized protein LOC103542146 [Equus przewalskii]
MSALEEARGLALGPHRLRSGHPCGIQLQLSGEAMCFERMAPSFGRRGQAVEGRPGLPGAAQGLQLTPFQSRVGTRSSLEPEPQPRQPAFHDRAAQGGPGFGRRPGKSVGKGLRGTLAPRPALDRGASIWARLAQQVPEVCTAPCPGFAGVCGSGAGSSLGQPSGRWLPRSASWSQRDVRGRLSSEPHTLPPSVPQLVSEKVGGAEGTKLDDDFKEMEKKVDVTSKAVAEVLARTIEYLQPNPASRAKLTMLNTVSKIRGQVKNPGYPQSEGLLGECMIRHGKELGGESNFGEAAGGRPGWRRAGRGVPAQAGRTALPSCRCRSFPRASDPLQDGQGPDPRAQPRAALGPLAQTARPLLLDPSTPSAHSQPSLGRASRGRGCRALARPPRGPGRCGVTLAPPVPQHHLKKLEGRRLDFDYKKKRQGRIPDEELRQAMEKFEESKEVAETSMHNLLETDIEQVSQLSALVDAQLDYHRQAVQILDELADKLKRRMREGSSRPRREYKPKPREAFELGEPEQPNGGFPCATAPKVTGSSSFRSSDKPIRTPSRSMRSMAEGAALLGGSGEQGWGAASAPPAAGQVEARTLRPPPAPLDQPSCKALYDFEPENDGELGFREGDIITLTNQIDENWYEGLLHGQSGFFPLSYVEVLVPLPQ